MWTDEQLYPQARFSIVRLGRGGRLDRGELTTESCEICNVIALFISGANTPQGLTYRSNKIVWKWCMEILIYNGSVCHPFSPLPQWNKNINVKIRERQACSEFNGFTSKWIIKSLKEVHIMLCGTYTVSGYIYHWASASTEIANSNLTRLFLVVYLFFF